MDNRKGSSELINDINDIVIQSENDLWIMAHSIFINILNTGLPVVRQFSDSSDFDHLWAPLEAAYKDFLFNVSKIL